jgi:hypothetical protein
MMTIRFVTYLAFAGLLGSATAMGCARQNSGDESKTAEETTEETARAEGRAEGRSEERARQEAARPRVETLVIPAGTSVVASLQTLVSTDVNQNGDPFTATTTAPIVISGRTVVPAGAKVQGALRNVVESGRIKGRAQMSLSFEQIADAQGKMHAIHAQALNLKAESETKSDAEKIAAGAIAGAIIGGIVEGKKGAAVGGAVGAGAGTIVMLATKGDDIELKPGQQLNVEFTQPASIPVVIAQR